MPGCAAPSAASTRPWCTWCWPTAGRSTTTTAPAAGFLGRAEKRRLAREAPEIWRQYGRKLDLVVVMPAKGCQQVVTAFVRNRLR